MAVVRFTQDGDYQLGNSVEATIFQQRAYPDAESFVSLSSDAEDNFGVSVGGGYLEYVRLYGVWANALTDGIYADFSGDAAHFVLAGGARGDVLIGGSNTDQLFGQGGDDLLVGGAQPDSFDGGDGTDTVSYATAASRVVVGGFSFQVNDATGDTFASVEIIIGSDHDDQFYTSGDTFYRGGDGADQFVANGTGPVEGGSGADQFTAAANPLNVTYQHAAEGVVVYTDNSQPNTGDAEGDIFLGTVFRLTGSEYDDHLVGTFGFLSGLGGDDLLQGGAPPNTFDGGEGSDTVSYANAASGVRASLAAPGSNTGSAADETYKSVENLTGSDFSDTLFGNAGANVLDGGAGADRLAGGAGDSLLGGAGADTLLVYGDPLKIDGGSERDLLVIGREKSVTIAAGAISGIEGITVQAGATLDLSAVVAAVAPIRLLSSSSTITSVTGSHGDDTINFDGGSSGINVNATIAGGEGDDLVRLEGRVVASQLSGGAGQDTLVIGDTNGWAVSLRSSGFNKAAIGAEFDFETVVLRDEAFVDLSNVASAPDRIFLRTTKDGFASLRASDGDDLILGGDGQDYISGSRGADTMNGGGNADRFSFESLEELANADSGATDFIRDFSHAQGDQIDLSGLVSNHGASGGGEFTFIGTDEFSGNGAEVRIEQGRNGNSFVQFDINNDGIVDAFFRVRSDVALTQSDFILVQQGA
jgi:Ca2+-binding RTX toxin-like protein